MRKLLAAVLLLALSLGAQAASIIPVGQSNTIQANFTVNRTSGKIPLCVLVNAKQTYSPNLGALTPILGNFSWDFGDTGSGNFTNGNPSVTSKNLIKGGPQAAHCYNTPGTYTINLTADDGTATATATPVTITATDYIGTDTVCYSSTATAPTAGVGGCPSGATTKNNATFTTVTTDCVSGTWHNFLLKGGDTFTAAAGGHNLNCSGFKIDSFGGSNATINASAVTGALWNFSSTSSDGRVTNLSITGPNVSSTRLVGASGTGTTTQMTFMNLTTSNFNGGWVAGSGEADSTDRFWDQLAIVGTTITSLTAGSGYASLFTTNTNLMLMDNNWNNNFGAEHVFRSQYVKNGYIGHNLFKNAATSAKQQFALAGPSWANTGLWTEHVTVADNEMLAGTGDTGTAVTIQSHNVREERLRFITFERNWVHTNSTVIPTMLLITTYNSVYRENICDMTNSNAGGNNDGQCISLSTGRFSDGTWGNADTNYFLNNIAVTNTAMGVGGVFYGIRVRNGNTTGAGNNTNWTISATNTTIQNNLVYSPNFSSNPKAISTDDSVGTSSVNGAINITTCTSCNTTDVQARTTGSVTFTNFPPTTPADLKPVCTVAYPCGQGVIVNLPYDMLGVSQSAPLDIGAIHH